MLNENVISVGHFVIVERQNYKKLYKVTETGIFKFGKDYIYMRQIIGKPYWTTFNLINVKNEKFFDLEVINDYSTPTEELKDTLPSGVDNRSLIDDGTSQKLSKEEIMNLRNSGISGKEMINTLIENSSSFTAKTEYSQQKYIKKKERKYFKPITILKTSISQVHEILIAKDINQISNLRIDVLSQILSYSNVCSEGLFMLYDSNSLGLPAASFLNRIGAGTTGKLLYLHPGKNAQLNAIQAMNFPKELFERMTTANIFNFVKYYYHKRNNSTKSKEENIKKHAAKEFVSEEKAIKEDTTKENPIQVFDVSKDATEQNTTDQIIVKEVDIKTDAVNESTIQKDTAKQYITKNDSITEELKDENIKKHLTNNENGKDVNDTKRKRLNSNEETSLKKPRWTIHCENAVDLVESDKVQGLVIIAKEHPISIVKVLLPFLERSRPFVIFHLYREPLLEIYIMLKQKYNIVNLKLFSNFLRAYQVLPCRTHPDTSINDCSGYLLTGYMVD